MKVIGQQENFLATVNHLNIKFLTVIFRVFFAAGWHKFNRIPLHARSVGLQFKQKRFKMVVGSELQAALLQGFISPS